MVSARLDGRGGRQIANEGAKMKMVWKESHTISPLLSCPETIKGANVAGKAQGCAFPWTGETDHLAGSTKKSRSDSPHGARVHEVV